MTETAIPAQRYVGASVKRSEDPRILTGRGRYIDDVQLPGMLHAAFVRSTTAHANITSVDVDEARALPGVVAVYTGDDMQALLSPSAPPLSMFPGMPAPAFSILATDKVRLVGDPIALVVAESRYVAEDAAELVEVDYDELTPIASSADALDPSNPVIFESESSNVLPGGQDGTHGDVDGAFASAAGVARVLISQHRHQNVPMECRGLVADFDAATGQLTVHSANQGVALAKMILAGQLGLDPDKLRILCGDIGGSFGLKIGAAREDIAVAAASRALERPVKWIEDRGEHLVASGHAREETMQAALAYSADGDILGIEVDMTMDTGAYPGMGGMIGGLIERMLPGPYKIGAVRFQSQIDGHQQGRVRRLSRTVGRRGVHAGADDRHRRQATRSRAARHPAAERRHPRRGAAADGHGARASPASRRGSRSSASPSSSTSRRSGRGRRRRGRKVATSASASRRYIEAAPGPNEGGGGGVMGNENMRMRLDADGTVLVFTGQMPHGQSHETTFAQIAADELGVPFEQVRVVVGDSDTSPFGMTGGSRAATMAGGATLHTARALKERILDVASRALEASPGDLVIVDGKVAVRGVPVSAIALADVAAAAASDDELEVKL